MNKHLKLLAATALAVSGMTSVLRAEDAKVTVDSSGSNTDSAQTAADRTGDAAERTSDRIGNSAERTGEAVKEKTDKVIAGEGLKGTSAAPDAEGIRDILAQVAEAALTEDGLNDIVERFADADRNRIGEGLDQEDAAYNDLVKQFRDDWKAKYGQDFNITNEEMVFKPETINIVQGEIGESARLAGDRAVDVDVNADAKRSDNEASADVKVRNDTGVDVNATGDRQAPADRNRNDAGRNTAMVSIPESHGMPALTIPLLHEAPDSWRIDIPDNLDANAIRTKTTEALRKSHSMKAEWPADVNDAYLAVSHAVLASFFEGQAGTDAAHSTPDADHSVKSGATDAGSLRQ